MELKIQNSQLTNMSLLNIVRIQKLCTYRQAMQQINDYNEIMKSI